MRKVLKILEPLPSGARIFRFNAVFVLFFEKSESYRVCVLCLSVAYLFWMVIHYN